ncbi:MAG: STY0301 family protein [Nitrosospira sp.]
MLSKIDRRIGTLLLAACSFSTLACAKPVSVCPKQDHATVQQIDIFDGKPEDEAYLAPDDPDKAPNSYTLSDIYTQGRTVTVRCSYNNGQVRNVELNRRTQTCRYLEAGKNRSAALVCR